MPGLGRRLVDFFSGYFSRRFADDTARRGADFVGEFIKRTIQETPQADVLRVIEILEEPARSILRARHKALIGTREEDALVDALASVIPRNTDGSIDEARAKDTFTRFANKSEEEFNADIEMLKRDAFIERLRRWWKNGEGLLKDLFIYSGSYIGYWDEKFNNWADPHIARLKRANNPKGVWQWIRRFICEW